MGFLSKIFKPVKKVFKAVGGVFKKVFKAVKKFAKSKLGKVLLTIAAVYFGGAALGFWGPGAAAGGAAASTVPIVQATPAFVAETAVGAGAAGGAATGAAAGAAGTFGELVTAASLQGATTPTATAALGGAVSAAETTSLFSKAVNAAKTTGTYLTKHPTAAIAGGKFIQSLTSEDQIDAQLRLERARQRRSNIGGLDYRDPYGTNPLRTAIVRQKQSQDLTSRTYGNG